MGNCEQCWSLGYPTLWKDEETKLSTSKEASMQMFLSNLDYGCNVAGCLKFLPCLPHDDGLK